MSAKSRKTRHVSANHPLPARPQTHGGKLTGERSIVLDDARQRDTLPLQPVSLGAQVWLISSSQDDDEHPIRVRLIERLPDGVRELRFSEAVADVSADDGVVT